MKKQKFQVTLNLDIDLNGTDVHEMLAELRQKVNSAVRNRTFTGYSDAEVTAHKVKVETVGGEFFAAKIKEQEFSMA